MQKFSLGTQFFWFRGVSPRLLYVCAARLLSMSLLRIHMTSGGGESRTCKPLALWVANFARKSAPWLALWKVWLRFVSQSGFIRYWICTTSFLYSVGIAHLLLIISTAILQSLPIINFLISICEAKSMPIRIALRSASKMDVTPKTSTKPLIHFLPLSRKRLSNARSLTSSLAPSIFSLI